MEKLAQKIQSTTTTRKADFTMDYFSIFIILTGFFISFDVFSLTKHAELTKALEMSIIIISLTLSFIKENRYFYIFFLSSFITFLFSYFLQYFFIPRTFVCQQIENQDIQSIFLNKNTYLYFLSLLGTMFLAKYISTKIKSENVLLFFIASLAIFLLSGSNLLAEYFQIFPILMFFIGFLTLIATFKEQKKTSCGNLVFFVFLEGMTIFFLLPLIHLGLFS